MANRSRGSRLLQEPILFAAVLALLLPCAAAAQSKRAPSLELLDIDPGQDVILSSKEPLYLRIRYRCDIPIHILVSGIYRGDVVPGLLHDGEELFPAGDREAVVWLAYPFGARIDQVRVRIWNANKARVAEVAFPIRAEWTDPNGTGEAAPRPTKFWVAGLTPGQRGAHDREVERGE